MPQHQVACKDEQISCLKAVVNDAEAGEAQALLRDQLAKAQRQQRQAEARAAAQVAQLRAALARATAQLKAAGLAPDGGAAAAAAAMPPPPPRSGGGTDQGCKPALIGDRRPAALPPVREPRRSSPDAAVMPMTPLSPGRCAQLPSAYSWDACSDHDAPAGGSGGGGMPAMLHLLPEPCTSPVQTRKGALRQQEDEEGEAEEEAPLCSPRSDLSGPSAADAGGEPEPEPEFEDGGPGGPRPFSGGAYRAPLACADNPLFRCSLESSRRSARDASASVEGGGAVALALSSVGRGTAAAASGGGAATAAAFGLLEIQLAQAQRRLGALQASAAAAGGQAAAAQARLRAGVRCLENLHGLLKGALDDAAGGGTGGAGASQQQQLRGRLAAAAKDLARLAKAQREVGACLDALRLLLARMAGGGGGGGGDDGDDDDAAAVDEEEGEEEGDGEEPAF